MKKITVTVFLLLLFSSSVHSADPIVRADGLSGRNDSPTFGLDDLVRTSMEGMFDGECGDYCIIGICAHLVIDYSWRGIEIYTIISPQLRTSTPDLLLASYNHMGEHPFDIWQDIVEKVIDEGNTSIIAEFLGADDGLRGGRGNPRVLDRQQSLSFKDVSIIGHPVSILPEIVRTDGSVGDIPEGDYKLPTMGAISFDNLSNIYGQAATGASDIYGQAQSGVKDLFSAESKGFDLADVYTDVQADLVESYENFKASLSQTYEQAKIDALNAYEQAKTEIGEFDAAEAYEDALNEASDAYNDALLQVSTAYKDLTTQVSDAYEAIINSNGAGYDFTELFAQMYDEALIKIKEKIEDKLKIALAGLKAVETLAAIKRETEKIQELAEFYEYALTVTEASWRGTIYGNAINPRFRAPRLFCPTGVRPLQPYYLSYVDAFFWRSGYPITDGPISGSDHSSTILNPFSDDTLKPDPNTPEIWGHMYPREGAVNSNHDAKVGTVAAWRALDVLKNDVKEGAGGTRFGVALPTSSQFDKDLKWKRLDEEARWQMIYPEVLACQATPAYNITDITRDFISPNEFSSYAFNYYNTHECCSNSEGEFLISIQFPLPLCLSIEDL